MQQILRKIKKNNAEIIFCAFKILHYIYCALKTQEKYFIYILFLKIFTKKYNFYEMYQTKIRHI